MLWAMDTLITLSSVMADGIPQAYAKRFENDPLTCYYKRIACGRKTQKVLQLLVLISAVVPAKAAAPESL